MFGSMIGNVILNVARLTDHLCTSTGCRSGRAALPWLAAGSLVLLLLAVARTLGPVFVTPAVGSWLATSPVDRADLLRPRMLSVLTVSLLLGALGAAVAAVLGGFAASGTVAFAIGTGAVSALLIGAVAATQASGPWTARVLTWTLGGALWALTTTLALGAGTGFAPLTGAGPVTWLAIAVCGSGAIAVGTLAVSRLGGFRHRDLMVGGELVPSISGALAGLDLSLFYDVLLARRWRTAPRRPARRGGPSGAAALVRADLIRLRRSPGPLLALAGALSVPYAAERADLGRVAVLIGALAVFFVLLPVVRGLRVLSRAPGLARLFPFGTATARRTAVVVPGALAVLFGLATGPALGDVLDTTFGSGVAAGVATGLVGLASAVRWVTGRPPDYSRPLVSTPAGAVPTNLYSSAVRGFDVLLLGTAPLLILDPANGVTVSLLISAAVIGYLTGRSD